MKRAILASTLAAACTASVLAISVGSQADASTTSAAALSNNWYASAPYLMPLGNNPPDPGPVMAATGQKAFQLAFILSGGGAYCMTLRLDRTSLPAASILARSTTCWSG